MIAKLKSGFRAAVAIGFSHLVLLLGSPGTANSQWVYYPPGGWGYYRPPMYGPVIYGPPATWQSSVPNVGRIPTGTGLTYGGGTGYGRGPVAWDEGSINEMEGRRIIHNYLKRKKIGSKRDASPRIRGTAIPNLRPDFRFDFQLINGLIIEYYSREDELDAENRRREFERRKEALALELSRVLEPIKWDWSLTERQREEMRAELTFKYLDQLGIVYERDPNSVSTFAIPRPIDFAGKKEIYEELGAAVKLKYVCIEAKKNAAGIEQELEGILRETIKGRILSERQAEVLISRYLDVNRIKYKRNTAFKTSGIMIIPDFLLEAKITKHKLPTAIEYRDPTDRRNRAKERVYRKYEEMGGKVHLIEAGSERRILSELGNKILPESQDETSPKSKDVTNGTSIKK